MRFRGSRAVSETGDETGGQAADGTGVHAGGRGGEAGDRAHDAGDRGHGVDGARDVAEQAADEAAGHVVEVVVGNLEGLDLGVWFMMEAAFQLDNS